MSEPASEPFNTAGRRTAPTEEALAHIGDAWHATSPQLGQGANMALLDAWALATAVRGAEAVPDALARFDVMRRRHVHLYQRMSAWLTPVYQSDSKALPFLRDWLAGPLSGIWPAPRLLASIVAGMVGRPLEPLGLDAHSRSR